MSAFFLMLGLIVGGTAAWRIVRSVNEGRFSSRIRELESKVRYAQGETVTLKEQITAVRAQAVAAEKTLLEERTHHTAAISQMAASFGKGMLALATIYFSAGLVLGGTTGWFGASWKIGAQGNAEKSQMEITARLAELKVELLEKQLDQLRESSGFFEKALREERVARAVAMTKLQILLESVTPQRPGEGLALDAQRLKKNLKDKVQTAFQDLPFLQSSPRP